jgi:hypothetical protein
MGISKDLMWMVPAAAEKMKLKPQDITICQLGNQRMRPGASRFGTYQKHLRKKGYGCVSIDWNGKDGARPLDLSKPLPEELHGQFDIVTNFGTTEHVSNQEQVFRNIHALCRVNGMMVHALPMFPGWKGHSPFHYDATFAAALALAGDYNLIEFRVQLRKAGCLLCFTVQKNNKRPLDWERVKGGVVG